MGGRFLLTVLTSLFLSVPTVSRVELRGVCGRSSLFAVSRGSLLSILDLDINTEPTRGILVYRLFLRRFRRWFFCYSFLSFIPTFVGLSVEREYVDNFFVYVLHLWLCVFYFFLYILHLFPAILHFYVLFRHVLW